MKIAALVFALCLTAFAYSQEKVTPVIEGSGYVYPVENAIERPDPEMEYKIVVDIREGNGNEKDVVESLEMLARMINLHAVGGVKKENMNIVAVLHGKATMAVMTNKAYKEKYHLDNPNISLIKLLKAANVKLFVCGQSTRIRGYAEDDILPEIGLSVSAQTILTTYQLKGYALMKF